MSVNQSLKPMICEEVFDDRSQPSEEEIRDFALQIGIDPEAETHLLPLARNGLMKPLPKHWKPIYEHKLGRFYYFNFKTKQSTWEHPLDSKFRQLVKKSRSESLSSAGEEDSKTSIKEELKSYEDTFGDSFENHEYLKDEMTAPLPRRRPSSAHGFRGTSAPDSVHQDELDETETQEYSLLKKIGSLQHPISMPGTASAVAAKVPLNLGLNKSKSLYFENDAKKNPSRKMESHLKMDRFTNKKKSVTFDSPVTYGDGPRSPILVGRFTIDRVSKIDIDKQLKRLDFDKKVESNISTEKNVKHGSRTELTVTGGGSVFLKSHQQKSGANLIKSIKSVKSLDCSNTSVEESNFKDHPLQSMEEKEFIIMNSPPSSPSLMKRSILRSPLSDKPLWDLEPQTMSNFEKTLWKQQELEEEKKSVRFNLDDGLNISFESLDTLESENEEVQDGEWNSNDEKNLSNETMHGYGSSKFFESTVTEKSGTNSEIAKEPFLEAGPPTDVANVPSSGISKTHHGSLEEAKCFGFNTEENARNWNSTHQSTVETHSLIVAEQLPTNLPLHLVDEDSIHLSDIIELKNMSSENVQSNKLSKDYEEEYSDILPLVSTINQSVESKVHLKGVSNINSSSVEVMQYDKCCSPVEQVSQNPLSQKNWVVSELNVTNDDQILQGMMNSSSCKANFKNQDNIGTKDSTLNHQDDSGSMPMRESFDKESFGTEMFDNVPSAKSEVGCIEEKLYFPEKLLSASEKRFKDHIQKLSEEYIQHLEMKEKEFKLELEEKENKLFLKYQNDLHQQQKLWEKKEKVFKDMALRLENEYETRIHQSKEQLEHKQNCAIQELKEMHQQALAAQEVENQAALLRIREQHALKMKSLREDLLKEEEDIRKEHVERILKIEESKDWRHSREASEQMRTIEKLRYEKHMLENKYRTLKEKYIKLKTQFSIGSGKKDEKLRNELADCKDQKHTEPQNVMEHDTGSSQTQYCLPSDRSSGSKSKTSTTLSSKNPGFHSISEKADQGTQLSSSDPPLSSKLERKTSLMPPQSPSCKPSNNSLSKNEQKHENSKCDPTSHISKPLLMNSELDQSLKTTDKQSPMEALRHQLRTLDELEEKFPASSLTDTYLRYPFPQNGKEELPSAELEFFRHRIHLERDIIRRAKSSFQAQQSEYQTRMHNYIQRQSSSPTLPSTTLYQMSQEEKELSDLESSLKKTQTFLSEKITHLRNLEKSFQNFTSAVNTCKGIYDSQSLKGEASLRPFSNNRRWDWKTSGDPSVYRNMNDETSSDSGGSSGFSSTEYTSGSRHASFHLFLDQGDANTSDTNTSISNLHSEISDLWNVLCQRRIEAGLGPPTLLNEQNRALFSKPHKSETFGTSVSTSSPVTKSVQQQSVSGRSSLVDRSNHLRHWLRNVKLESTGPQPMD